jgi:hypothetical protein
MPEPDRHAIGNSLPGSRKRAGLTQAEPAEQLRLCSSHDRETALSLLSVFLRSRRRYNKEKPGTQPKETESLVCLCGKMTRISQNNRLIFPYILLY